MMDGVVSSLRADLENHIASLRRYARALLRNSSDADDLVQETLSRALSRADKFAAGTNLRAWLFAIMHNIYVNQVRRLAGRPGESSIDEEGMENRLSEAARQESRIELRDLSRALDAIPEEQRQVLLLVALEGLKYDEVAQVLGVPIGTVMSRLSRAREAVRQKLSGNGAGSVLRRVK
ncbi:RNA polymerase sigma-70 factor, ECF subfamily [Azospirillaceae bacterium]